MKSLEFFPFPSCCDSESLKLEVWQHDYEAKVENDPGCTHEHVHTFEPVGVFMLPQTF